MDNPLIESQKTVASFGIFTYLMVLALAMGGGIANYISKVRAGRAGRFNFTELIGDMFISGFVGLLTFWLCQESNFSEFMTAILVGISGHMGARLIGKMEQFLGKKLDIPSESVNVTITQKNGTPGIF